MKLSREEARGNMKQIFRASIFLLGFVILSSNHAHAFGRSKPKPGKGVSITENVLGSPLTIKISDNFAGAIMSLKWDTKEFINSDDHGRELQSASSFDELGECYNPTEAGNETDRRSSTSKLLSESASGNTLQTRSQMAFWLPKGTPYPQGCGNTPSVKSAQNTTNLSNHIFSKTVRIGFGGVENAIEYDVNFHVAEAHGHATFETLTAYMPPDFQKFLTYDPSTNDLEPLSDGPGEQALPVILSTQNENFAMGIYSADRPRGNISGITYGRWNFYQATTKWNAVARSTNTPVGDYSFHLIVLVGNLDEVKEGMRSVYQYYQLVGPPN